MGVCGSTLSPEDQGARKRSKETDKRMQEEARADAEKVKLLLLGAGESGKSTIFKQMKIIYGEQFTDDERYQQLSTIYSNVVVAIKILAEQAVNMGLVDQIAAKSSLEMIRKMNENEPINVTVGDAIKELWNDPGMKQVWSRRSEFQIIDSVQYYFQKIDTIKMSDYIPDKDDILYSRVRTSGIVTERYSIDGTIFEMYDVGGQRNERKKWIHCFENVTAVIFVAAISEYDQKLFEDASTNRMIEALDLFEEICKNMFFEKSSIILFLNKRDLFAEKIKTKPISTYPAFSDYKGPEASYDAGVEYFVGKFMVRNKNANRQIYHHVTCATDTSNVKVVFNACKDIIIRGNLKDSGFMD